MLLPIKAICPKGKERADGTCLVFIQYRCSWLLGLELGRHHLVKFLAVSKKKGIVNDYQVQ